MYGKVQSSTLLYWKEFVNSLTKALPVSPEIRLFFSLYFCLYVSALACKSASLAFSSWIYRITHNETYDFFRSKKRRPEITLNDEEDKLFLNIPTTEENLEEIFDKNLKNQDIKNAIQNLEKKYKDIIILKFIEGKDYNEISDILQIPQGTVATLIHRAKKELKKNLERK